MKKIFKAADVQVETPLMGSARREARIDADKVWSAAYGYARRTIPDKDAAEIEAALLVGAQTKAEALVMLLDQKIRDDMREFLRSQKMDV